MLSLSGLIIREAACSQLHPDIWPNSAMYVGGWELMAGASLPCCDYMQTFSKPKPHPGPSMCFSTGLLPGSF